MKEDRRQELVAELVQRAGTEEQQRAAIKAMDILSDDELDTVMSDVAKANDSGLIKLQGIAMVWSNYLSRCTPESFERYAAARPSDAKEELFHHLPEDGPSEVGSGQLIGKTAVDYGFVSDADVTAALNVQKDLKATGLSLKLGVVMHHLGMLSYTEYLLALSTQQGLDLSKDHSEVFSELLKCPI